MIPAAAVQVVKGCWQLSGGHRGERETDRTGGDAAVADFAAFRAAGITTLDVADHYGPGEELIGTSRLATLIVAVTQACQGW